VGNLLTQRSMRTSDNTATLKLDLTGMKDGDTAGLCHFAQAFAAVEVHQSGQNRQLRFATRGKTIPGTVIETSDLWLCSTWNNQGISTFSYSQDGKQFTNLGEPYQLIWKSYRGDRIGIFIYNNNVDGGYIDADWFHYSFKEPRSAVGLK
jgi:hypothetical protein